MKPTQGVQSKRAADEQAALERTFEQGTALDVLPPEDRRAQPKAVVPDQTPDSLLPAWGWPADSPR
jgi:hypothetical protein